MMPIIILLVIGVVWLASTYRRVEEKAVPKMEAKWGSLGDPDVGHNVFDEGELFDWPYYRNVGWSWWFGKHEGNKPKMFDLGPDGTVNAGPPTFVESTLPIFNDKLFDDKMPSFAYAPPVAWIEKKE